MSFENAYRPYQPQQESSGKAVAALVLGICGLVVCPLVLSIPAVIFATLARSEIRESRGRLGGASLAQAGWSSAGSASRSTAPSSRCSSWPPRAATPTSDHVG